MTNVIAYTRVSTTKQANNGNSLDEQFKQLRDFEKGQGLKIAARFSDEESARNEEHFSARKGFKKAMALSLKKHWPIIVVDASRFSRTTASFDRFVEDGGRVYDIIDDFGAEPATMRAKIDHAQRDGEHRSKKTREGHERARAEGRVLGNSDPVEGRRASAVVRAKNKAFRLEEFRKRYAEASASGAGAPKAAAKYFNDKGWPTAQGLKWEESNLREHLKRMKNDDKVLQAAIDATAATLDFFPSEKDLKSVVEELEDRDREFEPATRASGKPAGGKLEAIATNDGPEMKTAPGPAIGLPEECLLDERGNFASETMRRVERYLELEGATEEKLARFSKLLAAKPTPVIINSVAAFLARKKEKFLIEDMLADLPSSFPVEPEVA